MSVTLPQAALSAALRLGDSAEEVAEATRLLAYATTAIERHLAMPTPMPRRPLSMKPVVRLAGYLFDMPTASRGMAYSDALRNSGAAAMLLPYRVHRAGSTAEAVAARSAG